MIRRPLIIVSTALAMTLLSAPGAMADIGATGTSTAAASCAGALKTSVGPTMVTVTGQVKCTADTDLALRTSAKLGQLTVNSSSTVHATANTDVPINATLPVPGWVKAGTILVNTSTGATVAAG
jgi:hypothetical protein